jgi:hypothetical protein
LANLAETETETVTETSAKHILVLFMAPQFFVLASFSLRVRLRRKVT